MKNRKNSVPVVFAALICLALAGCDAFNFDVDRFIVENTAEISLEEARSVGSGAAATVAMGTDGVLCVKAGAPHIVEIPLGNPENLALVLDLTTSDADISGVIEGNILKLNLLSKAEGVEPEVEIVITTDNGRPLIRKTLTVAYIDFDTSLSSLVFKNEDGTPQTLSPAFSGTTRIYSLVGNYPYGTAHITAAPANDEATVIIEGDEGGGFIHLPVVGGNTVTVTVSAPHGAAKTTYTLHINRVNASDSRLITSFTLSGKTATPGSGIDHALGTITITLPYGVSRNNLTPVIQHTGKEGGILPTGPQNFTSPVQYTVTAETGDTKTYTVTVTNAALTSIAYTGTPTKTEYGIETAVNTGFNPAGITAVYGTDSLGTYIPSVTLGTISYTHDFRTTGTKTVTITAGGNPAPSASVTVTVKDFSLLGSLSISGNAVSDYNLYLTPAFSPTTTSYTLKHGNNHVISNFTITIYAAAAESSHAAVSGADSSWNGTGTRQITVTPASGYGASRTYTLYSDL